MDGSEIFDVREQQGDFDDVGRRTTPRVENRVEGRQHAARLRFESVFEFAGVGIASGLRGHENQIAGANRLRVSAERRRRRVGFDPCLVDHLRCSVVLSHLRCSTVLLRDPGATRVRYAPRVRPWLPYGRASGAPLRNARRSERNPGYLMHAPPALLYELRGSERNPGYLMDAPPALL